MNPAHIGSDLDTFLRQEGLIAECEAGATRRVATWQIEKKARGCRSSRVKPARRRGRP